MAHWIDFHHMCLPLSMEGKLYEMPLSKLPLTPHWSELNHMPTSRAEIGLLFLRFKDSLPEQEGG